MIPDWIRKFLIGILFLLAITFSNGREKGPSSAKKLWYDQPAASWNEALPIGNGRLGAMVFGGITEEHLQFNENTLYSGEPSRNYKNVDDTPEYEQVMQLLQEE